MAGVFAREHKRGENRINAEERTRCAIMSVSCAFPLQHWQSCATGMVMRDCLIKMFVLEVFKINVGALRVTTKALPPLVCDCAPLVERALLEKRIIIFSLVRGA